mgnify:CR=1 FL=1
MTGKYDIEIYNKRVHYHLTVKRNITVIQGDSATGKTELLRMISDYENNGISSGITQICEKRCVVMENASWKERLATLQQCIIFIDEGAPFLRSKEFTRMVKGSDNYFVLVTRDSLEHLPYSIEEIYGMRQERDSQKYQNAKRIYNETYQLYNLQAKEDIQPDLVITEDSNSGYEFYHKLFGETYIFYTAYLIEQTRNTIYEYSKKKFKDTYLTSGNFRKIVSQLPEQIRINC